MSLDVNKLKEVLQVCQPYLKYIIILVYGGQLVFFGRVFLKDNKLRTWIMASFEETNGRASGKSLTAFLFSQILAFSAIMAILYSPNHILPEYFLVAILTFVGSLYGIKVASKYFSGNVDNSQQSQQPPQAPAPQIVNQTIVDTENTEQVNNLNNDKHIVPPAQ